MNFHVVKISDSVNNFYYYFITHIENDDINFSIAESFGASEPENPINMYLNNVVGWDNIDVMPCPEISCIQVLNKSFAPDPKNMVISDEYKKVMEEAMSKIKEKKPRAKKVKEVNEATTSQPKPKPKSRSKKAVADASVANNL